MLRSLSIRDVVLIDRLDVAFEPGLCVLTGETGAGKSILLDSLGLALGARADAALVRAGAEQAAVTAAFEGVAGMVRDGLAEQGIVLEDDELILRRVVSADGRSRAFVNGAPVNVATLRGLGDLLAEVQGQFENQRLMSPPVQRDLLDAFGGHGKMRRRTAEAYLAWRAAETALADAREAVEKARRDEEFLRHAVDEIRTLEPAPGEEAELSERRSFLMHGEQVGEALDEALRELNEPRSVESALQAATRHLERVAAKSGGRIDGLVSALDRAATEVNEAFGQLERASADLEHDPGELERTEERLFALRALARKHGVEVDGLAALADDMAAKLAAIEDEGATLERLKRDAGQARNGYEAAARALSEARKTAGKHLGKAVAAELAPLKLGNARLEVDVSPLEEDGWGETGMDAVRFLVATNPGAPLGPIGKVASGGELARFMLALKVVLAAADPVPTLVFDEVDSGIGGATAAAVGERLAQLGESIQVLVVTHSPQVASRGAQHLRVSKGGDGKNTVNTRIATLDEAERREEIARMLAGAEVTDEARAAAGRLLAGVVDEATA